ncbi:MAG: nickel pincer cofactor biosynthesis protein LarB [Nitrospinota bacterium]
MGPTRLRELLQAVAQGAMSPEEAAETLRTLPFENLGFARVDHHRTLRTGCPEVVYCEGKRPEDVEAIVGSLLATGATVLATRVDEVLADRLKALEPRADHNPLARTVVIQQEAVVPTVGKVLVVTAGTSDIPVAEEAAVTAQVLGSRVERLYDVGVAGIHRLLDARERLEAARVMVVVAGMDGVLPSVVGGLVEAPIIAVPTSVGYGASFGGLSALLSMLNSCAPGVAVVNIDNGFGAGFLAHSINRLGEKPPPSGGHP